MRRLLLLALLGPLLAACQPIDVDGTGGGGSGAPFWADPTMPAARQAADWRSSRPADAAIMDRLAATPTAVWFGDWNGDVRGDVARLLGRVPVGQVPVLVTYNLPHRDCGHHSAGGVEAEAYRRWTRDVAAGIGDREAVVVLEPDGLGVVSCLSPAQLDERLALLADAVAVIGGRPGVDVYLAASSWVDAPTTASRLDRAGVRSADGFALNVSGFETTAHEVAVGRTISASTGGAHFVVDTSRNGAGSDGEWCNPSGRAVGASPTRATGDALVDAYLWIKVPGQSDGACNGGPDAGGWMPEYALDMARRAGWGSVQAGSATPVRWSAVQGSESMNTHRRLWIDVGPFPASATL